jgi:hypothetical protein
MPALPSTYLRIRFDTIPRTGLCRVMEQTIALRPVFPDQKWRKHGQPLDIVLVSLQTIKETKGLVIRAITGELAH